MLAAPQAGLVNAHDLNVCEHPQRAGLLDVELYAPPQLFVSTAQKRGGLAHRKVAANRQRQRFKGGRESPSRSVSGHVHLRALAA